MWKNLLMICSGDLNDAKVKKEYERAYGVLLNFFHSHFHQ